MEPRQAMMMLMAVLAGVANSDARRSRDGDDGVYEGEDDDGDADSGVLVSAKTGHTAASDVDNAVYRQVCRRVNSWDVK